MMTDLRPFARPLLLALCLVPALGGPALAQSALARARQFYNQQQYDQAIAAADEARAQAATADAAAVVLGRAHLERYRRTGDPVDLSTAREALRLVHPEPLGPRDRVDLLVGLALALFFANDFGAAADVFDVAWGRADALPPDTRRRLLDWWASAVDRDAQQHPPAQRAPYYRRLLERASAEAQHDPMSAPAAYWIAVATRGTGDLDGAAAAVLAAWVRCRGMIDQGAALRNDLDRLVLQALIPERARVASGGRDGQQEVLATLTAEWELFKQQWK